MQAHCTLHATPRHDNNSRCTTWHGTHPHLQRLLVLELPLEQQLLVLYRHACSRQCDACAVVEMLLEWRRQTEQVATCDSLQYCSTCCPCYDVHMQLMQRSPPPVCAAMSDLSSATVDSTGRLVVTLCLPAGGRCSRDMCRACAQAMPRAGAGGATERGGTWHDWPTASNAAGRDAAMQPALTDHARRGDSTSLTKGDLDGNRLSLLQLPLALLLGGCA